MPLISALFPNEYVNAQVGIMSSQVQSVVSSSNVVDTNSSAVILGMQSQIATDEENIQILGYALDTLSSNVYPKIMVDNLLSLKSDKLDTFTKSDVSGLLVLKMDVSNAYDKSTVDGLLSGKVNNTTLSGYYLKTETDNLLSVKMDVSNCYNISGVNSLLSSKMNIANSYDISGVNNLLNLKMDIANVFNKNDISGMLLLKSDVANVFSKNDVSGLLVLKSDVASVYDKVTSDGRYLQSTDLTPFMKTVSANATFQPIANMGNYYTSSQCDATFQPLAGMNSYVLNSALNTTLSGYVSVTNLNNSLSGYVQNSVLNSYSTTNTISANYVDKISYANNISSINVDIHSLSGNFSSYATLQSVSAQFTNYSTTSNISSNYYLKSSVDTLLNAKLNLSLSNQALGYCALDSSGKVAKTNLPYGNLLSYLGLWNGTTPNLVNGTGNVGDVYISSFTGTHNFGSGSVSILLNDWIVYDGTNWDVNRGNDQVSSFNSRTGAIVPVQTDYDTYFYTKAQSDANYIGIASVSSNIASALSFVSGNYATKLDISGLTSGGVTLATVSNNVSGALNYVSLNYPTIANVSGNISSALSSVASNYVSNTTIANYPTNTNLTSTLSTYPQFGTSNSFTGTNNFQTINVSGNLNVSGNANIYGSVYISGGTFGTNAFVNITNSVNALAFWGGHLVASDYCSVSGNLYAYGSSNLVGGVAIQGATTMSGILNVSGLVTLKSGLNCLVSMKSNVAPSVSGDVIELGYLNNTVSSNVLTLNNSISTVSSNTNANTTSINSLSGTTQTNITNINSLSGTTQTNIANINSISGTIFTNIANINSLSGALLTNTNNISTVSSNLLLCPQLASTNNFTGTNNFIGVNISGVLNISGLTTFSGGINCFGSMKSNVAPSVSGDVIEFGYLTNTVSSNVLTLNNSINTVSSNTNANTTLINSLSGTTQTNITNISTLSSNLNSVSSNINTVSSNLNSVSSNMLPLVGGTLGSTSSGNVLMPLILKNGSADISCGIGYKSTIGGYGNCVYEVKSQYISSSIQRVTQSLSYPILASMYKFIEMNCDASGAVSQSINIYPQTTISGGLISTGTTSCNILNANTVNVSGNLSVSGTFNLVNTTNNPFNVTSNDASMVECVLKNTNTTSYAGSRLTFKSGNSDNGKFTITNSQQSGIASFIQMHTSPYNATTQNLMLQCWSDASTTNLALFGSTIGINGATTITNNTTISGILTCNTASATPCTVTGNSATNVEMTVKNANTTVYNTTCLSLLGNNQSANGKAIFQTQYGGGTQQTAYLGQSPANGTATYWFLQSSNNNGTVATQLAGNTIQINGVITTNSSLNVSGATTISGTLQTYGNISATGINTGTLSSNIISTNALNVSGNATISGTLQAYGNISATVINANTLNVSGNTTISGTLQAYGNISATVINANTLNISGTLSSNIISTNTLNVSGSIAMNTGTITSAPSGVSDIVNKSYCDSLVNSAVLFPTVNFGKNFCFTLSCNGITGNNTVYTPTSTDSTIATTLGNCALFYKNPLNVNCFKWGTSSTTRPMKYYCVKVNNNSTTTNALDGYIRVGIASGGIMNNAYEDYTTNGNNGRLYLGFIDSDSDSYCYTLGWNASMGTFSKPDGNFSVTSISGSNVSTSPAYSYTSGSVLTRYLFFGVTFESSTSLRLFHWIQDGITSGSSCIGGCSEYLTSSSGGSWYSVIPARGGGDCFPFISFSYPNPTALPIQSIEVVRKIPTNGIKLPTISGVITTTQNTNLFMNVFD